MMLLLIEKRSLGQTPFFVQIPFVGEPYYFHTENAPEGLQIVNSAASLDTEVQTRSSPPPLGPSPRPLRMWKPGPMRQEESEIC